MQEPHWQMEPENWCRPRGVSVQRNDPVFSCDLLKQVGYPRVAGEDHHLRLLSQLDEGFRRSASSDWVEIHEHFVDDYWEALIVGHRLSYRSQS